MANEEHVKILRQGVEVWNKWREENPEIEPDFSKANFSKFKLSAVNLSRANLYSIRLIGTELFEANLNGANFNLAILTGSHLNRANLNRANLNRANLNGADLTLANLNGADLNEAELPAVKLLSADLTLANLSRTILLQADLNRANLNRANLNGAELYEANLNRANLYGANLNRANLTRIQALETNFTRATLTGACIEDWHTNSETKLDNVICEYIYLRDNQQERRPSSGKFAPGEFTKLFQKSLETIDLIFRNGIDWDAFAYSFKKIEIENQGAQLDVNIIEKKGDGVIVVRINASPDADKTKIHGDFMQGYEFAHKALEAQYQARIEDKNLLIAKQETQINRLFDIIDQQGAVQQALADNPRKVSNYDLRNSQLAGGIVDAQKLNAEQIGGEIQN